MPEEIVATDAALEAVDAQATKDAAKTMAAILADGIKKTEISPTETQVTEEVKPETQPTATEELTQDAVEEAPIRDLTEVEKVLQDAGIDIGITAQDVPVELHPAYERMIQSVIDFAERGLNERLEASRALQQVEAFKQRLESSPDKIILALAMSRPDVFAKVMELYQAAEQDPQRKELIMRDLEAEAKYQEADRRERLMDERDRVIKARQVIAATKRAATAHGVTYELAEKVVALAIQANKGDLDVADVNGIVSELRPAKKIVIKPKIQSPAKQEAVKTAPTGEVTPAPATSPGLEDKTNNRPRGGGRFRQLISDAVSRLNASNKQ